MSEKIDGNKTERTWLQQAGNENSTKNVHDDNAGVIAQNVMRVSNLLSSSPTQLAEQAKSYALGKVNNTIATETQKWLAQFGTARINFAFDRKGKLDNGALDLLLPLYDNKADWLFFSQLGYRNKDSRHTVNLGFGGRYFTPGWMYGLNTFFDHDVTGNNKRLGLGGEAWTDYVKLSANTYWRLSKWHDALHDKDYEERPANGFDLNSEFFLPAYPNLGGKLSYEQYFGDNVALFNRDSTQKNPSLARLGLNYTPIPLVTMGVDYKFGGSGHSETLFQANLNYRFGTPFSVQMAPDSVASMRTLAGSRYDLVERNNNIVLDYKKKPELAITLPDTLSGYSSQTVITSAKIISSKPLKKVNWKANKRFYENKGILLDGNQDEQAELVLPKYVNNGINRYTLSATAEEEGGKSKTAQMNIDVEPFVIKAQSITSDGTDPVLADGKSPYHLAATITHGNKDNDAIRVRAIPDVKWSIEPENPKAELSWDKSGTTNDQGQLTATLVSTEPLSNNTKVYLEMDGMPKMEITGDKRPTFTSVNSKYQITTQLVEPTGPLSIRHAEDIYTFKATILDQKGNPLRKEKIQASWTTTPNDGVTLKNITNDTTNEQGQLIASLHSTKAQEITVTLSIKDGPSHEFTKVSFEDDSNQPVKIKDITFDPPQQPYVATASYKITVYAQLTDENDNDLRQGKKVSVQWFTMPEKLAGFKIDPAEGTFTTDQNGKIQATLTSTRAIENAKVGLSVNGGDQGESDPFTFIAPSNLDASLEGNVIPPIGTMIGDGKTEYPFKVQLIDNTNNGSAMPNQSISRVTWGIKDNKFPNDVKLRVPEDQTTDEQGYLTAFLTSTKGVNNVIVTATLNADKEKSVSVEIEPKPQLAHIRMNTKGTSSTKDFQQQEKPYNIHKNLIVTLLTPDDNKVISGKDNSHKVEFKSSNENIAKVNDEGQITFPVETFNIREKGTTTVTARITNEETGEKSAYVYTFNPQQYIFTPTLTGESDIIGSPFCYTLRSEYIYGHSTNTVMSASTSDIGATDALLTENSFNREYDKEHFPDFVIFPDTLSSDHTLLKLWDSASKSYKAFDYSRRELYTLDIDEEKKRATQGRLICKLSKSSGSSYFGKDEERNAQSQ
ncbi:inverse autotransporter beta domain-containing protein [Xenorhabdus sp. Sc-CR9]|uniref:inverse autotransporter beta domain-containing protein n=1 Tax=Xenorhabdus sp. Sc-CR9 TaxID=2584468 RepID=UPI001F42A359